MTLLAFLHSSSLTLAHARQHAPQNSNGKKFAERLKIPKLLLHLQIKHLITMKNILFLLIITFCLTACKKAVYNRNCCEQPGIATVFFGGYLTIPNAFTPNGDGVNDQLIPITYGVTSYTLTVVLEDETLFQGINEGWDGKINGKAENGIYGYVIDIEPDRDNALQVRGQICTIVDPANACIKEADRCAFENQFVPDANPETIGEYDTENIPGPVFCDE